jgi:hypothetical protein
MYSIHIIIENVLPVVDDNAVFQLVEEAETRRSSSKPKAKKTVESVKNAPKAASSGAEKTDEVAPNAEATAKKVAKKAEEPAKAE